MRQYFRHAFCTTNVYETTPTFGGTKLCGIIAHFINHDDAKVARQMSRKKNLSENYTCCKSVMCNVTLLR